MTVALQVAMIQEHVAIITGASSGIGRTTAQRFAEGSSMIINADVREAPRKQEGRVTTHELIHEQGGNAEFIETDVTDWDDVKNMVEDVVERHGHIDVMINNAGVAERAPIDELPIEDAHHIFRVNGDGVYHGMKAVVPYMKERGNGVIVNISSGAGRAGIPELAAYCGSKFAVIGMTEAVAKETEIHGIRVNAVCPGRTRTAMTGFTGVPVEKVVDTIMMVVDADYTGKVIDVR